MTHIQPIMNLVIAVGVLVLAGAAHAATIPITNAGFEAPDVGSGNYQTVTDDPTGFTGWDINPSGHSLAAGMHVVDENFNSGVMPPAADGTQWIQVGRKADLAQKVGVLDASLDYTLTLTVGDRTDNSSDLFDFGLWADSDDSGDFDSNLDTQLAVQTQLDVPNIVGGNNTADTELATITFDAAGSSLAGDDLYVVLRNTSGDSSELILYDSVSLTAVPEPASIVLGIAGMLGMLGMRPRRRR